MESLVPIVCTLLTCVLSGFNPVSTAQDCPNGWFQHGNNCFFFSKATATWEQASGICHAFGTKLAEPSNADINNFIKSEVLQIASNDMFYVGISDMLAENDWVLASSITPVNFTDWNPGEPDESQHNYSQDCVAILASNRGHWIDHQCFEKHLYICQKEIPVPAKTNIGNNWTPPTIIG